MSSKLITAGCGAPPGERATAQEFLVRELIIRTRREQAKREALPAGSSAHSQVGVVEARLIRELHNRFGIEDISAADLEWYVSADGGDHRRRDEETV